MASIRALPNLLKTRWSGSGGYWVLFGGLFNNAFSSWMASSIVLASGCGKRGSGLDRMRSEQSRQCRDPAGSPAPGQACLQFFQGAFDPHFGGALADVEQVTRFPQAFLLEETKQENLAVSSGKLVEQFIQERGEFFPFDRVFSKGGFHGNGALFAGLAAGFGPPGIDSGVKCGAMDPGGQLRLQFKPWCGPGQPGEDGLHHVFGQTVIVQLSPGHGVNQVGVTADQLGESLLATPGSVLVEQFDAVHFTMLIGAE
jgi:hypothetical protein